MLFLMFRLGADRYVLDVEQVEEVLPFLEPTLLPGAPHGVAGAINYRGQAVPLLDLSVLALGRPSAAVISTRVILIRYPVEGGETRRLGLVAERVIETVSRDPDDFVPSGVDAGMPPYLGPVASDAEGVIQLVRAEALLPVQLREILFRKLQAGC